MKDVLPINRGRVVPKVMSKIGIDIEDTSWIDEPYYQSDIANPGEIERAYLWLLNHEWRIWTFIIVFLVFFVL